MDDDVKDKLYREIQSFFSKDTLILVGSGLSCAEGLPGMWDLAAELIKSVPEEISIDGLEQWDYIKGDLLDEEGMIKNDANLEAALLKYPPDEELEGAIQKITTKYIKETEQKVIKKVISGEKNLRFSSLIRKFSIPDTGLPIICTNYDRLIEIACEVVGIPVDNLFYGKYISYLDEKKSQMSFCKGIERNRKARRRVFTEKVSI